MKRIKHRTANAELQNGAFTLIEMLVVIAVIAILATLIAGGALRAYEARKISRVDTEKHRLINAIEAYQHQMGSFPPDNGRLTKVSDPDRIYAATNQLFYELTGPTYDAKKVGYVSYDTSFISSINYFAAFNREGVANSIEPRKFYNPPPKAADYKSNYVDSAPDANVLIVPVDLVPNAINAWRYDSSSTNRHNTDSFDVWAVFKVGDKIVTNGNW